MDYNLYRYTFNGPTNGTDPTGLVVVPGTETQFTRRKELELHVETPDKLIDGTLKIAADTDIRIVKDGKTIGAKQHGVLIEYVGKNADKVRFIQFFTVWVTWRMRSRWTGEESSSHDLERIEVPNTPSGAVESSTQRDNPVYVLDVYRGSTTPIYTAEQEVRADMGQMGGVGTSDTERSWLWDEPLLPNTLAKRQMEKYKEDWNIRSETVDVNFETYAVIDDNKGNGKAFAKVVWVSSGGWTRENDEAEGHEAAPRKTPPHLLEPASYFSFITQDLRYSIEASGLANKFDGIKGGFDKEVKVLNARMPKYHLTKYDDLNPKNTTDK